MIEAMREGRAKRGEWDMGAVVTHTWRVEFYEG
jgi:hypothetical protein